MRFLLFILFYNVLSLLSSEITFVGTNAYWLGALNSDKDVDLVFDSMQEAGVNIVRTWAFNGEPRISTFFFTPGFF